MRLQITTLFDHVKFDQVSVSTPTAAASDNNKNESKIRYAFSRSNDIIIRFHSDVKHEMHTKWCKTRCIMELNFQKHEHEMRQSEKTHARDDECVFVGTWKIYTTNYVNHLIGCVYMVWWLHPWKMNKYFRYTYETQSHNLMLHITLGTCLCFWEMFFSS